MPLELLPQPENSGEDPNPDFTLMPRPDGKINVIPGHPKPAYLAGHAFYGPAAVTLKYASREGWPIGKWNTDWSSGVSISQATGNIIVDVRTAIEEANRRYPQGLTKEQRMAS